MGGALKAIGNFVNKAAETVGKVASTVSDIAGKVANFAGGAVSIGEKIMNFASKGMEALSGPIKEKVGGFLDKLPFGLGKIAGPLANKLIDGAASFLSGPVNAGVNLIGKALPFVKDVANFAETVKKGADQVGALTNPAAQFNFANNIANIHAQHIN